MQATVQRSAAEIKARPRAQVLIIGAGINGIATLRDLALQGIDVILVDRGDYASGATAASSHMIHGGIRYLENGEFRLVKESVVERNALLKLAPHYVKPLKTTVPIFSTFSGILAAPLRFITHRQDKPQERGALLIKVGLTLYDFFSRDGGSVPRHQFRGARRSLRELPALNPGVKYTASYYDASMHDPERLALDVLSDGLAAGPHARAANYLSAIAMSESGVLLRDELTGEEFEVDADVVVNTSGPWVDLTNEALGLPSAFMGGTKGSHIVLDHPELLAAVDGREIFFEHSDGRIVLIYPLRGRVLVGTTDLEHDMTQPIECTEPEVDYFFDLVSHVFPLIGVDRSHIVYRFAGVRPLPRHDDEKPGFVSRDYRIEAQSRPGGGAFLSLVGGKWTTFRALAEHLSNEILMLLATTRAHSTAGLPIGGGKGFPRDAAATAAWLEQHRDGLSVERAAELLARYGTRAIALISHLQAGPDEALEHGAGFSRREIAYLAEHEAVQHLDDLVMRRTNLAFEGRATPALLREIAAIAAETLGWGEARQSAEISRVEELLAHSGAPVA